MIIYLLSEVSQVYLTWNIDRVLAVNITFFQECWTPCCPCGFSLSSSTSWVGLTGFMTRAFLPIVECNIVFCTNRRRFLLIIYTKRTQTKRSLHSYLKQWNVFLFLDVFGGEDSFGFLNGATLLLLLHILIQGAKKLAKVGVCLC